MNWLWTAVLTALALGLPPAASRAQSATELETKAKANAALAGGDMQEAARLYEQVYKSANASLGPRHPLTLNALSGLGTAYLGQGRSAEAREALELAVKGLTETVGLTDSNTLNAQNSLAQAYAADGQPAKALALQEATVSMLAKVFGSRNEQTLVARVGLAEIQGALGRRAEALAVLQETIPQLSAVLGEKHRHTVMAVSNLGAIYYDLGRFDESLAIASRVLQLRLDTMGPRHPSTLMSYNSLATTYRALGRHAEELAVNENLVRLCMEVLGPRHRLTLAVTGSLAQSYLALGRPAEALAASQRQLRMSQEANGERHPSALLAMLNVAAAYQANGQPKQALEVSRQAAQLYLETLGERHPRSLHALANLAVAYEENGQKAESLVLNEKIFKLRTELLGERHPDTLLSMLNVAQFYANNSRAKEAVPLYEKALRLYGDSVGERHPLALTAMYRLAVCHVLTGQLAKARALGSRYVDGAEWQRSQAGLSADNRQAIFQQYAQGYRFFSMVNGALGESAGGFYLSELGKARTLLEGMVARRAGSLAVLPPDDQAALKSLDAQLSTQNQLIAQTPPDASTRPALEAARNGLVRKLEALQQRLKEAHPKYAQLADVNILGARDLQGLVPADAIAISYVLSEAQDETTLWAWLVDDTGKVQSKPLGSVRYLGEVVEALRRITGNPYGLEGVARDAVDAKRPWRLPDGSFRFVSTATPPPQGVAVADPAELAGYLSRILLQPMASELKGKRHWIISPDGPLAQLPFELLSLDGQRVLEQHPLHYTQSLSIYALAKARQQQYQNLPRPKDLFAMGNPLYEPAALPADKHRTQLRGLLTVAANRLLETKPYWRDLPGTRAEIAGVAALFAHKDIYMQDQASEARLQQLNATGMLKDYRYLHFAVHGNLSTVDPALSSLVLSQANVAAGTDGYITAAEWPGYDLRSDLTVLSACDTGLGKTVSGEGVMGLPFALFVAGSVNTTLSLWPVDDESTAKFMKAFFAKLKAGQSATQALSATKREFAKDPKYGNPFYWAPFVLVGAG